MFHLKFRPLHLREIQKSQNNVTRPDYKRFIIYLTFKCKIGVVREGSCAFEEGWDQFWQYNVAAT